MTSPPRPGSTPARQFGAELAVIQTLIHMGQHGAARPRSVDPGQCPFKVAVGRMRRPPQAVDDPQLDAFDRGERSIVEFGDIGRVGKPPDAQAERLAETMILRERHDRNALDFERADDFVRHRGPLVAPVGFRGAVMLSWVAILTII